MHNGFQPDPHGIGPTSNDHHIGDYRPKYHDPWARSRDEEGGTTGGISNGIKLKMNHGQADVEKHGEKLPLGQPKNSQM
jgi:hypothetical protein